MTRVERALLDGIAILMRAGRAPLASAEVDGYFVKLNEDTHSWFEEAASLAAADDSVDPLPGERR